MIKKTEGDPISGSIKFKDTYRPMSKRANHLKYISWQLLITFNSHPTYKYCPKYCNRIKYKGEKTEKNNLRMNHTPPEKSAS